jgi:hypothetical protein
MLRPVTLLLLLLLNCRLLLLHRRHVRLHVWWEA